MQEHSPGSGSPYLSSPIRTLYDACREAGRDKNGTVCPECPVRSICDADRWRHIIRDAAE